MHARMLRASLLLAVLVGIPVAAFAADGARAQAAQSASAKAQYPNPEVPAGADGRTVVTAHLEGVRNIYRETARMLGSARPEERNDLITLQNYCSRSLGRLREMLNQLELKPVPNGDSLVAPSRQLYDECKTRYDGHRAG